MGKAEREILRVLRQTGEAYQSEMVKATGFSKSTVSEALRRLVERRLVRRVAVGKNWKLYPEGEVGPASRRRDASGRRLRLGFTRAAEYPFLVPFRKAIRDIGFDLQFKVYNNGIEVVRDLSLFRIDLGLAPTLTLFLFHSSEAPVRVLAPAGSGGASVVLSAKAPPTADHADAITCTKISTMELMMRSAVKTAAIPEAPNVVYASGPEQMRRMIESGSVGVGCLWEPYATILEARGAKRLLRYSELGENVCCALAAGNHISEDLMEKVVRQYAASVDLFRRDPEEYLPGYGVLSGLESSMLRRVRGEYSYPADFTGSVVEHQFERAGVVLPSPSSFREALFAA